MVGPSKPPTLSEFFSPPGKTAGPETRFLVDLWAGAGLSCLA